MGGRRGQCPDRLDRNLNASTQHTLSPKRELTTTVEAFFPSPDAFSGKHQQVEKSSFFLVEMKLAGLRRVFRQVKPTPFPSPNQTLRRALPRKKYSLYLEESHPLNFKKKTPPPLFPYLQRLLCVIFSLRLFVRISHPPFLGKGREGKGRHLTN